MLNTTTYFITGILCLASISCTVFGNILLKIGTGKPGMYTIWPFNLINLYTVSGAAVFGCALIFYMMILKRLPLNVAQTLFSIQFVFVILGAYFILGEAIGPQRWIGIGFIALGLFVIAFSSSTPSQLP